MQKIILYFCLCVNIAFASANLCDSIDGFYSGTYVDSTGLFPNKAFPLNIFLTHQNNLVYGYTLAAEDQTGAHYGQEPYAIIWANCQDNQLSHLYIIPNNTTPCGDFAPGPFVLNANEPLSFILNYENAMINATLKTTLWPSPVNQPVDQAILTQAQTLAQSDTVQSCH